MVGYARCQHCCHGLQVLGSGSRNARPRENRAPPTLRPITQGDFCTTITQIAAPAHAKDEAVICYLIITYVTTVVLHHLVQKREAVQNSARETPKWG